MDNVNKELIQKIQTSQEVFTILSRATRQPFVICDPESFNDQVWIFENKEDLEEAAKPLAENKNPIAAIKVENKSFLSFYTALYTLGVNSIVYHEKEKSAGTGRRGCRKPCQKQVSCSSGKAGRRGGR